MKKYITGILLALSTFFACKDVIFIPTRGSIEGFVTDANGSPIVGLQLEAGFTAPSQDPGAPALPTTLIATTDHRGYYRFSELWDEVQLNIAHPGSMPYSALIDLAENDRPVHNIGLVGSPTIKALDFNKTTLSAALPDTIRATMLATDPYNEQSLAYTASLLLQTNGQTRHIIAGAVSQQGLEDYLIAFQLTSGEAPPGSYSVVAEVRDPDGNSHRFNGSQTITVEQ